MRLSRCRACLLRVSSHPIWAASCPVFLAGWYQWSADGLLSVLVGGTRWRTRCRPALVGGYAALCVFTSIWLQSALVKLSQDASEMRRTIKSLNTQIKEQVLVRYLPPALINDIFEGKVSMDTKPTTQEITVLFSDLSGFTKMSEEQGAETVADFLNDYLTVMNETIFQNNGTIDKFIGDAIMVLFGAPVPMTAKEQAENAARCARAMQAGMVLVNEKWKARDSTKFRCVLVFTRARLLLETSAQPSGSTTPPSDQV